MSGREADPAHVHVGGTSRTVGVIGWPVSGSLSPVIHNAAFASLGLDWVYVPLPVPPGRLPEALAGLGALGFAGANVTMPHKTETSELMDERSEEAERLRAVNTVVVGREGRLVGHNTDAPGFVRFLREDVAFEASGRSALIYGAGGAARACALALATIGMRSLTIAAREPEPAAPAFARVLEGFEGRVDVERLDDAPGARPDLIVNATPLGAGGESLPLPPLGPDVVVVDLLYRASSTPLQDDARRAGATAFSGLGLLLHQAALSFELWTGQVPPLAAMSAAALAELAEAGARPPPDPSADP